MRPNYRLQGVRGALHVFAWRENVRAVPAPLTLMSLGRWAGRGGMRRVIIFIYSSPAIRLIRRHCDASMSEFLSHWWAGDAAQYYQLFGLTLGQVNKIAKIGLYLSGTLVLFDLVAFSQVIGRLRVVTFFAVWAYRCLQSLLNVPSMVLRIVFALLSALLGKISWRTVLAVPASHFSVAVQTSAADARSFALVRALSWLEDHPISDRAIKIANFCFVLVFAFVELFTS